jgi:phosphate transport system substrate-binding protein
MKFKIFILMLAITASLFYAPTANADSLTAAGSTFSGNFIDRCRILYAKETGNTITYAPIGSGAGRNNFFNNLSDFAITDTPYGASENKPTKEFLYIPLVAGPIAVTYRLDNYPIRIKLTKEVLAKIFAGKITMWNDPEIKASNVGKIPATKITVVYRQDGSGTSEVFTSYLNAVAPKIWTKPGNKAFSQAFPGVLGAYYQGVSGSTQIAFLQATTNGSISYNEISYAKNLKTAMIENEAKKFMAPTPSAASVFLSSSKFNQDGTAVLNYKNPSPLAYNISTFAYGLAYKTTKPSVKEFFNFALSKCNKIDGYASITGNALKVAKTQVSKLN